MRRSMLPELKKVFAIALVTTLAGAVVGILVGALTDHYLLWGAVFAGCGAALGLALAYGFLPES
jgi:F0F1-type ATP synthase assembly protein I